MDTDKLRHSNIENLTNLFTIMGAREEEKLHLSDLWPDRLWMPYAYNDCDLKEAIKIDSKYEKSYILSLWEYDKVVFKEAVTRLEKKKYKLKFEQTGMFLDLNKADVEENVDLKIKLVKNKNNILIWTKIASVSFGQEIDEDIIRKIAEDKNIYLLLGYKKDIGVATALLYANSDVMGVHLVGVLKEYRGQGIAENLMKRAINFSKEKNIDVMVLQASILGLGIYKKLGFIKSFILRNYQKN